jgi:hypothetical protein
MPMPATEHLSGQALYWVLEQTEFDSRPHPQGKHSLREGLSSSPAAMAQGVRSLIDSY